MSIFTVFVSIFTLIGLGFTGVGVRCVLQAQASSAWPHVAGEVTRSEIKASSGEGSSYAPHILYSYQVSGQPFEGSDICFGIKNVSATYAFARSLTERYRTGAPVMVYYNPSEPAMSVLEPGISKRSFIQMAFGLVFATFGGFMALFAWLFAP